jgi:hypothetical protein
MLGRLSPVARLKCVAVIVASLGLPMTAAPALASGGLWCKTEDDNVKFDFSAGQSRDGAGGWFGLQGSVVSKIEELPPELARFDIKDGNLTQRWADRDSIRLEIESHGDERQNYASVRLTVIATALEELTYKGPYLLRIHLPDGTDVTRDGAVECSAE